MEKDIEEKIFQNFGNDAQKAIALTNEFEKVFKFGPRVTRCVVHLANGDISKLKDMIKNAETDWRDVIMWAETTTFEFDKPFQIK